MKRLVFIVSLNTDESFQAVPLGAACIVSALRADSRIAAETDIRFRSFSQSEAGLSGLPVEEAGRRLADILAREAEAAGVTAGLIAAGFSVYVWNRPVLEAAALALKTRFPDMLLFAGGPEITACAETPAVFDWCIRGEGEEADRLLVNSWLDGAPSLPPGRIPVPLATLPSPWLDGTLDSVPIVRDGRGALWELSRGCPFSCSYCYESRGEKTVREIPLPRLEKELEYFSQKGIERIFVLDPTYNASKKRALSLLALIEQKAPDIHFNFEIRAELVDQDLAQAFSRIPCSLQIGLQTVNETSLSLVNRPVDFKKFAAGVTRLNTAGIVFGMDLMYGLPGDNLKGFKRSLDYAIARYPNNLEIFRLAVLPGTELHDRAESLGLVHDKRPPYLVTSTPTFPAHDLERAGRLARAVDYFYTQGRAVSWFLAALHPLDSRPSRFFAAFSGFPAYQNAVRRADEAEHRDIEAVQLAFLEAQYREAGLLPAFPLLRDLVCLNGAWTRALAEGETTELDLSWHPEDLFSPDALDIAGFSDGVCMEPCRVRVFSGPEGPDLAIEG
ncbi:MAG TPA: B12-binding domain-containing radical SAM protein [Treponemataceae bacterium]|nr:B12-binding domain-containing radical SAM protein [Treponemataceae bacterium]